MANPLSTLFVQLKLNADTFNNGLKQAAREAKEFEKNLKPTLTAAKDLGIAMAAAGAAVVGTFAAMSKSAVDYGDKLNDARQRTGATVEALARLGFAAEQSGSSFEGMSTGLRFLARNMETAIAKGGEQRAAFNALGVSSKDLAASQGDVNKVFLALADRFAELPDGAEKSALAMRVFGKSGADLIPLLNEGSAGIARLGDEAEKAGLVISQDFAKASDELNDTLNEVKAATLGASVGIAQALLPTLQSVATATADAVRSFSQFSQAHPQLIQGAAALGAALLTVGTALTAVAVVVPKLQAGFLLMKAGVVGLGGAMGVLSGVAIVALVASLVALVKAYQDFLAANANLKKQLDAQDNSAKRAADSLNKYKIAVQLVGKSENEQTQAIAKAGKELQAKLLTTKKATDTGKEHARTTLDEAAAAKVHEQALKKQASAIDLSAKALQISLELNTELLKNQSSLLEKAANHHWPILESSIVEAAAAANLASAEMAALNDTIAGTTGASEQLNEAVEAFISLQELNPGVQLGEGIEQATKATKNLDETFRSVKNTATKVFTDMFREGEISFTKLGGVIKGIFETIASEILATFTAKLITPLVNRITEGLSGLLGSIPGLGGIFGGGAGAGAGAGGAAAGAGAGGGSAALGAFFTNPFTIAIGGAIAAAIGIVKSQAHHEANTFVREFQNPFGEALGEISDAFADAESAGKLTIDAAEEAKDQVVELWDTFQKQAKEFAKKGKDEAKVVSQAFAQLEPLMKQIFSDMDKSVKKLKENSGEAVEQAAAAAEASSSSITALSDAARSAIDPIMSLADSIGSLASAAASAGAGAGSSTVSVPNPGGAVPTPTTSSPSVHIGSTPGPHPIHTIFGGGGMPSYQFGTNHVSSSATTSFNQAAMSSAQAGSPVTMNVYQQRGEDGEQFARRVARDLNRYVERGGGRLVASAVNR